MTKSLVQGKIGYYANGVLLYKPKARQEEIDRKEREHEKRNKQWKTMLQQKVLISERCRRKISEHSYSISINYYLEWLKNCSKQGRVNDAIMYLGKVYTMSLYYQKTSCPVRFIFYPDIEERSALYYAAHTGKCEILEFYLSLYLMYSHKLSLQSISMVKTFQEWFEILGTRHVGLVEKNKFDYSTCVLNSLNGEARYILTKKKIGIRNAMSYVKRYSSHENTYGNRLINRKWKTIKIEISRIENLKKKIGRRTSRNKAPRLNNTDLFADSFGPDDDVDEHNLGRIDEDDEYITEEPPPQRMIIKEEINDSNMIINKKQCHHKFNGEDNIYHAAHPVVDDKSINSISSASFIDRSDENVVVVSTASDNERDDSISCSYSIISDDHHQAIDYVSIGEFDVDDEKSSHCWDIVSDVQSVISLGTTTDGIMSSRNDDEEKITSSYSYRDALLSKIGKPQDRTIRTNYFFTCDEKSLPDDEKSGMSSAAGEHSDPTTTATVFSVTTSTSITDKYYCGERYRDEYKLSRGGKPSKMFKGNEKTRRVIRSHHRRDRKKKRPKPGLEDMH